MRPLLGFFFALVISTSSFAVTYTENFNDGAANGWTAPTGTWAVTSSTYRSTGIGGEDISVYGGDRWATNFTYSAALYNAYHQQANQVGLVYNYKGANNYYAVKFSPTVPTGTAYLVKVVSGTETIVATQSFSGVGSGVWFTATVVRSGTRTTVKVNGVTVFDNVLQNQHPGLGRVGLITTFAEARFNNVTVTQGPLFATGFEGITLGDPVDCQLANPDLGTESHCWQDLIGTDSGTGFAFPIRLWNPAGPDFSRFQLLTGNTNVDETTIHDYMKNELRPNEGRNGSTALFQTVTQRDDTGCCTQNSFIIFPGNHQSDLYLSFWLMLQSDLATHMTSRPEQEWRTLTEFKPYPSGNPGPILHRMQVSVNSWNQAPTPRFNVIADNLDPYACKWFRQRDDVTVPAGEWFRVEIFVHRTAATSGRYWAAINGQTLFNYFGVMAGPDEQLIEKLFPFLNYSGGAAPFFQWVDDLEIWDRFPTTASPHPDSPVHSKTNC